MIISLFAHNQPGVRGTIDTSATPPTATGVGRQLLATWMRVHSGQPAHEAVVGLEEFYSTWSNQAMYAAVEPGHHTPGALSVVEGKTLFQLIKFDEDTISARTNGEWHELTLDEVIDLSGASVSVSHDIVDSWDSGEVETLDDAKSFEK